MARLARLYSPEQPQHVIQRGNNRQEIFSDAADFRRYLELLGEAVREYKVALHAYVLMPNHVHLLATPATEDSLPKTMQALGRRYVRHFNVKTARSGTLWEGRYRSTVLDTENYFMTVCRYIEMNPVRAGLAEHPSDYPWSSFRHHAGEAANPLITDHPRYWALGNTPFERQAAYRALCADDLSAPQLTQIRDATNKGWVLGSAEFARNLQGKATRRVTPLPKGRPAGSFRRPPLPTGVAAADKRDTGDTDQ